MDKEIYVEEMQNHIDMAERMKDEMPPELLKKFTNEMWMEHEGYIKGLKTALNILDKVTSE